MSSAVGVGAVKKALDFAKLKSILHPNDFSQVNQYRQRHMELTRLLQTPLPKLDMNAYKQQLKGNSVVVEVEQELSGFQVQSGDVKSVLKSLDEQERQMISSANETVEKIQLEVKQYKNELEGLQNLPHYDHLTPNHVYTASPGLERVYHQRLREGKVFHDDHQFGEQFFG